MAATNQCHATRPEIDRIAITGGISYHCQKILELHINSIRELSRPRHTDRRVLGTNLLIQRALLAKKD